MKYSVACEVFLISLTHSGIFPVTQARIGRAGSENSRAGMSCSKRNMNLYVERAKRVPKLGLSPDSSYKVFTFRHRYMPHRAGWSTQLGVQLSSWEQCYRPGASSCLEWMHVWRALQAFRIQRYELWPLVNLTVIIMTGFAKIHKDSREI